MPFTVKDWQDAPSTATPITAAALEDVERRVTAGRRVNLEDYIPGAASVTAAIESAITAATVSNTIPGAVDFEPGKTYSLTTRAVRFLTGNIGVEINGNGAKLVLSSAAPRAFDLWRVADGETHGNLWIHDLTVDANSIGGREHVVLGNWIGGSATPGTRMNIDNIRIDNVTAVNVPIGTDSATDLRIGLALSSWNTGDTAKGTGTTSSGSNQITSATTTSGTFANGQVITGAGIPTNTTITAGAGTATLTISANATASASGVTIAGIGSTSIDSQNTVKNIWINNYNQTGGLTAVQIAGMPLGTGTSTANVWIDNVHVDRGSHINPIPTAINASNHIIIGNKGYGGWASVRNFKGVGCLDCGIEINSIQTFLGFNNNVTDAFNHAYYHNPYHAPADYDSQLHRWIGCTATRTSTNVGVNNTGIGWSYSSKTNMNYAANVLISDCEYVNTAQVFNLYEGIDCNGPRRIRIRDFTALSDFGTYSGSSNVTASMCRCASFDTLNSQHSVTTVDGYAAKIRGTKSGTGTVTYTGLHLAQTGMNDVSADRPVIEFVATSSVCYGIMVGDNGAFPQLRGVIKRPSILTNGASSTSGIRIGRAENTTITGALTIEDPDFSKMQSNALDVDFVSASNAAKVQIIRPRWRVAKTNVSLASVTGTGNITTSSTSLTSATGTWQPGMTITGTGIPASTTVLNVSGTTLTLSAAATATTTGVAISTPSPFVWQNVDGYTRQLVVQGGTVTLLEKAVDAVTYVNLGITQGLILVEPGAKTRETSSVDPTRTLLSATATPAV